MSPLVPDGQVDLKHRAHYLSGTYRSIAAVASREGHISLIDFRSNSARSLESKAKLEAISLHPSAKMIAYVDGKSGRLFVIRLTGTQVTCIEPPCIAPDSSEWIKQCFHDCHFEVNRDFLWAVAPLDDYNCEVSLVDTKSWSVIHRVAVKDRIGQSSFSFHETFQEGLLSLWMAAGQDGQEVVWLTRDGNKFTAKHARQLSNCSPPAFSQDGSEFLVSTNESIVRRFKFPIVKPSRRSIRSPIEDDPFKEFLCYIGCSRAVVTTISGRVFLIDTDKMVLLEEAEIPGHEPRPIGVYYPQLKKGSRDCN